MQAGHSQKEKNCCTHQCLDMVHYNINFIITNLILLSKLNSNIVTKQFFICLYDRFFMSVTWSVYAGWHNCYSSNIKTFIWHNSCSSVNGNCNHMNVDIGLIPENHWDLIPTINKLKNLKKLLEMAHTPFSSIHIKV